MSRADRMGILVPRKGISLLVSLPPQHLHGPSRAHPLTLHLCLWESGEGVEPDQCRPLLEVWAAGTAGQLEGSPQGHPGPSLGWAREPEILMYPLLGPLVCLFICPQVLALPCGVGGAGHGGKLVEGEA